MSHKTKYPLAALVLAATLFFPLLAQAQQVQELVNQQDWVSRQQQKKIADDKRSRQQAADRREQDRNKQELVDEEPTLVDDRVMECSPVTTIYLVGANSISQNQQQKLTAPFMGRCLEPKVLTEVITTLKTYYKAQGYATPQVSLLKQNLQTGVLELKILEKKIDQIILNDNSFTDKMQKLTAFGNIEGKNMKFKDIDQGLNQINRLPSNNATITKMEPSAKEGETKVYIANEKAFPARATLGYDSLGNEYTGIYRTSFSGGVDNLLFLNDAINLSYTANLNDDRHVRNNKSFTGDFSVPFGYNTFSYDYSRSEFMKFVTSGEFSGYNNSNNFTLDRVLFSQGDLSISGNSSLNIKSAASSLNHQEIEISKRNLSIASIEFTISNSFKNGTDIYLRPTYSQGLKILDAKKDSQDLSSGTPRAQFQRAKFYATISKTFTIPKLDAPVILATEMDSQFSNDVLFGSEQFSVGGYDSVRGFRDTYLTGDKGYYFRNSANFNVGSLILPLINQENLGYLTRLNKFKIEPFYDYGHVQTKHNSNGGRLAGTGVKTSFDSKYFSASLTYSVATNRSKLLNAGIKENKMIYFELSATCC